MAKDQLDHDEIKDTDDIPVLADDDTTDQVAETDDEGDQGADDTDGYDIRDDLDDSNKHVLGLLSDEELAALSDDDDEDPDAGEADADQDEDPARPDAGEQQETQQAADPQPQPAQVELTAEQIAEIKAVEKAAKAEAMEKWRDGELTDDELDAEFEAASGLAQNKAQEIHETAAKQKADDEWSQVVEQFHNDARGYFDAYPDLRKPEHLQEFDRHVKAVTGSRRYDKMSNQQKLESAHRLYMAEAEQLGFEVPKLKQAAKPKPKAETTPQPKPKPRREVVPTLARVPAAATNDAIDSKYGQLESLMETGTPEQIERALAKLSPEEREAFASMDIG